MISQCALCALEIDPRCLKPCEEEYWRGLHDRDSDPPSRSLSARVESIDIQFHQACWQVARSQVQLHSSSAEITEQFRLFARDTRGFCSPIPTTAEPWLDLKSIQASTAYNKFASKQEKRRYQYFFDSHHWRCRLPVEILDRIFWELKNSEDVGRFGLVTGLFPSSNTLRKLMTWNFGSGILEVDNAEYPRILINIAFTPKMISPSLSNHLLVIRRTIGILGIMHDLRVGSDQIGYVDRSAPLMAGPVTASALTFYFAQVGTIFALVGIDLGNSLLGFQHGEACIALSDVSALRFVQNDYGITSVQTRATNGWRSVAANNFPLQQDQQEPYYISYCTEFDGIQGCCLTCELDSFKMLKLNIASGPCGKDIVASTWRHSFPPNTMHSRLLLEPSYPHEWELLLMDQPLKSFNTFVSGPDFAVTGFSAQMACGSHRAIGVTDESVLMLAFHIIDESSGRSSDQSSTMIQAATSSVTGQMILKVAHQETAFVLESESDFTNEPIPISHGLAVAFGQRGARTLVCGLASMELKGTPLAKARPSNTTEHIVCFRPTLQDQKAFVYSEANLANVTVITSYSREADSEDVSGFMLTYNSARTVIVGEARYEQRSVHKDASDCFTHITAYYEPYMHGRRLVGLRFGLENRESYMFGTTSGFAQEEMALENPSCKLVLLFTQVYSEAQVQLV